MNNEEMLKAIQNMIKEELKPINNTLSAVQGDITDIQGDITTMKGDITAIQGDTTAMKGDITAIQGDTTAMKGDIANIDCKVDKNTILLENLNTKVQVLADVQENHLEMNERRFNNILEAQSNTNSLITSSLQRVSNDVKSIGIDLTYVEQMTGKNITDIARLKSIK